MKDISTLTDIEWMVNSFYSKVRKDDLIGPIFNRVIGNNWDEHLPKMYRFWQSILLNEPTYSGRPFPPHMKLDIDARHFDRWLSLFENNLSEHFEGPVADEALQRANLMAKMFQSKIEYFRSQGIKPLV